MQQYSKLLAYILRHAPDEFDLSMDRAGWVSVDELLDALKGRHPTWNRERLEMTVSQNSKQRFEFSEDGSRIRARQGHSVDVHLGWEVLEPPARLFHGTVSSALDAILEEGLRPMSRHDVHLSEDVATAREVGARRGAPVVLQIDALNMHEQGFEFRRTANGVWLVRDVPSRFLSRHDA